MTASDFKKFFESATTDVLFIFETNEFLRLVKVLKDKAGDVAGDLAGKLVTEIGGEDAEEYVKGLAKDLVDD